MTDQISMKARKSSLWVAGVTLWMGLLDITSAAPAHNTFAYLSTHDLDIQLDGRGGNASNAYGTFSPSLGNVSPALVSAVQKYEGSTPTPHTRLANCRFIGALVELDNQANREEWVITTTHCAPSAEGMRTFWLVQEQGNAAPRVVLAERGQQRVFIALSPSAAGYRPITFQIHDASVTVQTSQGARQFPAQCRVQWTYAGERYAKKDETMDVWLFDPAANAKAWVDLRQAFAGQSVRLPSACPRQ